MTPTEFVVQRARELGFQRIGVVPIAPPNHYSEYLDWTNRGFHGGMDYMANADHIRCRADPSELLDSAKSAIIVALAYAPELVPPPGTRPRGRIARYACGTDYHGVIRARLSTLAEDLAHHLGHSVESRVCVDSAPVLERDLAERANLGFVAKNTMLIAPGLGSYTVLGELFIDIELAPTSAGPPPPRCGQCTRCLDACPTDAFVDAHWLDARKCISYLTIEHRGAIPMPLREPMGTMIFGCDICQSVCPFNAAAPARAGHDPELSAKSPDIAHPDLIELLRMSGKQIDRRWKGTALERVSRARLLRNVCVALGNAGHPDAVEPLSHRLTEDPSELVRAHAAWALGKLGAVQVLEGALPSESSDSVLREIRQALSSC